MGCINSKKADSKASPPYALRSSSKKKAASAASTDYGSAILEPTSRAQSGTMIFEYKGDAKSDDQSRDGKGSKTKKEASKRNGSLSFSVGLSHRFVEAELNAAGWPPWLTAAAGEAIHGWVPLKADSFEKLEKIGQGTYSSVFRAREVKSGRIFALKKVRFDNFQPESIRFMAREITILRRLDHPNIMKLEGLITSRISSSIYLVFEYMEHDLAGLISCPDINFSESQIKCYLRQLLSGLEHCHIRGIMHRDIKSSNILVNNEGILKIGDFGLANILSPSNRHSLTSRVVTLWYRPPELLMGSTSYGVSVDLWSVGCVFAELFLGKPVLKGRTEVEQLHKIFKLCGSPPDEFWRKLKLPHATMFKPQTHYESCLWERCKDFPVTAVKLIETLLSIDPHERGTASSALMSEYFSTKPYACDPSSLPKYPPNKEMDAKNREDAQRKKNEGKVWQAATSKRQRQARKVLQEPNPNKPASKEETHNNYENAHRDDDKIHLTKGKGGPVHREPLKPSLDAMSETSQVINGSHGYSVLSGPIPVSGSSGFTWAKRRKPDVSSTLSDGSKSKISALDPSFAKGTYDLPKRVIEGSGRENNYNRGHHYENARHMLHVPMDLDPTEQTDAPVNTKGYRQQGELAELSGLLKSRPNEYSVRRAARRSRFGKDT